MIAKRGYSVVTYDVTDKFANISYICYLNVFVYEFEFFLKPKYRAYLPLSSIQMRVKVNEL